MGASFVIQTIYRPPRYFRRPLAPMVPSFLLAARNLIQQHQSIRLGQHSRSSYSEAAASGSSFELKDPRTYCSIDLARLEYLVPKAYNHVEHRHDLHHLGYPDPYCENSTDCTRQRGL